MVDGAAGVPADAPGEVGARDGTGSDERPSAEELPAAVDAHLAEPLALAHRQANGRPGDHALDERPIDADRAHELPSRDERQRTPPVTDLRTRVDVLRLDERHGAVARETPPEKRGEVAVSLHAGRAAED